MYERFLKTDRVKVEDASGAVVEGKLSDFSAECVECEIVTGCASVLVDSIYTYLNEHDESVEELDEDELDELREWFLEIFDIGLGNGWSRMCDCVATGDLVDKVKCKIADIVESRKKYYRVTMRATNFFDVWVRADSEEDAEEIAGSLRTSCFPDLDAYDAEYEVYGIDCVEDEAPYGEEVFTEDDI